MTDVLLADLAPFRNEEAAYCFIEQCVWPAGPVCPRCGGFERIRPLRGRSTRIGVYKCYACRKPFTVKVGTFLESSNLPMHKWLQAIYLACHDRSSIDAGDLHRELNVARRTAHHVLQRVRFQTDAHLQQSPELTVPVSEAKCCGTSA